MVREGWVWLERGGWGTNGSPYDLTCMLPDGLPSDGYHK